jgi:ubiquinone/menaquinone biosynthesis C-methylase UbiE
MEENYEDKYYSMEEENWWFKARRNLITSYLQRLKAQKILDVGCGAGGTMEALRANGFSKVCGIDISQNSIRRCQKKNLRVFRMQADNTGFKDNSFDAIIAADILEHTKSDEKTLAEWNRILRPDGHIILFVPAFMHLWSKHDELSHHRKRYRLLEVIKLAESQGFVVKEKTYWNTSLYFPRVIVTRMQSYFNSSAMHFPRVPNFLNKIVYGLLAVENGFIERGISFPFGISCFAILRKQKKRAE